MASVGEINAQLTLSSRQFSSALKTAMSDVRAETASAEKSFNNVGKSGSGAMDDISQSANQVKSGMKDIQRIVSGIMISQTFYQGLSAIKGAYAELRQFNEGLEQTKIALKYLVGDADRAESFLYAIEDFAAKTPYTLESATQAVRTLMSMSFKDSEVLSILTTLSDASAVSGGSSDAFNRIVYALGQIRTAGKLMNRDLMQLAQAGIPVFEILQEELGLTADQVQNIGDEGISAMVGIEAILNGLNKRYAGAADEIALTTQGLWSTIVDNSLMIGNALTEDIQNNKKSFLQALGNMLADARSILQLSGKGGLLEAWFPDFSDDIRLFIGYLGSLRDAAKDLIKSMGPMFKTAFEGLIVSLNAAAPLIITLVRGLTQLMQIATSNTTVLRIFTYSLVGIGVAAGISKIIMGINTAIQGLALAAQASVWVGKLASAFKVLSLALITNPIVAIVTAIVVALGALLLRIEGVRNAIKKLVGSFTGLFGFNIGDIWQTEDMSSQVAGMEDFYGGLSDVSDGLDDVGKEAANAGKAVRNKFIMAFDEVYNIDDPMQDMADNIGSIADALDNLQGGGLNIEGSVDIVVDKDSIQWPDEWEDGIKFPPIEMPQIPPLNWGTGLVYEFADALQHMQTVASNAMLPLKEFGESLLPNLQLGWEVATSGVLVQLGVLDSNVGTTFAGMTAAVLGSLTSTANAMTNWANSLSPNMATGLAAAQSLVSTAMTGITNAVQSTMPTLHVPFAVFASVLAPSMQGGFDSVGSAVNALMSNMSNTLTQPLPSLLQQLGNWAASLAPNMQPGWSSMAAAATAGMATLGTTVRTPLPTLLQELASWASSITGKIQPGLDSMLAFTTKTFQAIQQSLELSTPKWLQNIIDFASNVKTKWDTLWDGAKTMADTFVSNFEKDSLTNLLNKKTKFDSFKETVSGIWDKMWDSMETASSLANGDLGSLMHTLTSDGESKFTTTGKNIDGTWTGMWSGLLNTLRSKGVDMNSSTGTAMAAVANAVLAGAGMLLPNFMPGLDSIIRAIGNWAPNLTGSVSGAFTGLSGIARTVENIGRSLGDWLWRGVSGVVNGFAGRISGMLSGMTFTLNGSARFAGGLSLTRSMAAPGLYSHAARSPQLGDLPAFARGGIVGRDIIARVGEGNKREAIIPLQNSSAMAPFADAVAERLGRTTSKQESTERPVLYVGTLVADDRGLRELERRMEVIRAEEDRRRG